MIKSLTDHRWIIFTGIAVSVFTPMLIIGYEVLFRGEDSVRFTFNSTVGYLLVLYYVLLILLSVALVLYWLINQIKIIKNLKTEKTKAELSHLKAQVNPHFFFNMLNNLYGWIDRDPSQAKNLILKLSDMMRYSIYEGQKDMVFLTEEVDFLKNYIELNRIRYHKKIDIDFLIEIENKEVKIMPLMFIILVENAFKHGVEKLRQNTFVHIILKEQRDKIYFEIKNNFDAESQSDVGIGLQNLESRLKIIYPKHYSLTTSNEAGIYTAQLILTI